MARSTFFSFHYSLDCWRASQIKNSWVTQDRKSAGFFNSVEWEEVKKKQDSEIEKWIDRQLVGTSVTV
ncbi:MAG: TIR domain-containing protein, partial [bacterium]|nr:TIR domain-containing protein [bacterium]